MKKTFLIFLFFLLFLFSITFSYAGECTPPKNFDYCYEENYRHGDCSVNAKIYLTHFLPKEYLPVTEGTKTVYYFKDEIYVNVGYSGDELYRFDKLTKPYCDEYGCDGRLISKGKISLAKKGQSYILCSTFAAWDYEEIPNNCWAYAFTWYQIWYKIGNNCIEGRVVDCYQDNHCSSGYVCDKSGNWKDWKCIVQCTPKTCSQLGFNCGTADDGCGGTLNCGTCPVGETCQNNICVPTFVCNHGDVKCEGYDKYSCSNNKWNLIESNSTYCGYVGEPAPPMPPYPQPGEPEPKEPSENFLTKEVFNLGGFSVQWWMLIVAVLIFLFIIRK